MGTLSSLLHRLISKLRSLTIKDLPSKIPSIFIQVITLALITSILIYSMPTVYAEVSDVDPESLEVIEVIEDEIVENNHLIEYIRGLIHDPEFKRDMIFIIFGITLISLCVLTDNYPWK